MMKSAVHHSIYHQCFVIICRNSHTVEFSVDILYCNFFRDFYCVPRQMQISGWSFSALRGESKQPCSSTDGLTCRCSLAPLAPRRPLELVTEPGFTGITTFGTENSSKYFWVKGIHEQGIECYTDATLADCQYQRCALLGHLAVQTGQD